MCYYSNLLNVGYLVSRMNVSVFIKERGYTVDSSKKSKLPQVVFPYEAVQKDEDNTFHIVVLSTEESGVGSYTCRDCETGQLFQKEKIIYAGLFRSAKAAKKSILADWRKLVVDDLRRAQIFSVIGGVAAFDCGYAVVDDALVECNDNPICVEAVFGVQPNFVPTGIVFQSLTEGFSPLVEAEERFDMDSEEVPVSSMGLSYRPAPHLFGC